ncbi:MAG: signal peptidase I [Actinomycetia bacterium]|nr:signal peptidase I [Actinomycetes bacterium]MCP5033460.1 signal peptidase I [Actinomycetes bacterium]
MTRNALEWAVVLVGAVLVALLLRASLFQAFYIPSESMETTLVIDDRVLVNKISYRLHDINRGDIVVFARPDDQAGDIRDLIKRVIALPGETVEGRDNEIFINGQRLSEPYLDEGVRTTDFPLEVVPEGMIFVMGDNRGESFDSRLFGPISEDRVVGRAFVLFWPLGRAGSL